MENLKKFFFFGFVAVVVATNFYLTSFCVRRLTAPQFQLVHQKSQNNNKHVHVQNRRRMFQHLFNKSSQKLNDFIRKSFLSKFHCEQFLLSKFLCNMYSLSKIDFLKNVQNFGKLV